MILKPTFPTILHQNTAELVRDFFLNIPQIDTVLVVNSCARGQATPDSDLDFAILVNPDTTISEIQKIEATWLNYSVNQPTFLEYKKSNQFAHLHLDIIDGKYSPAVIEVGEPIDYLELEIGNQLLYSAPIGNIGLYFKELQNKWLPFYEEELRSQRLAMIRNACEYDLNHIPVFIRRGLHFQAFDILYKAFQEYLQALFIANQTYPIAYNKWIKYQIVNLLHKPDLYLKLPPIISVNNIESNEINDKAEILWELLKDLTYN
jgi:predicted nucleotidyltransferase